MQQIYNDFINYDFSKLTVDRVMDAVSAEVSRIDVWKHPLGFNHAELTPLVEAPPGERFRLHFWLNDRGVEDELGDLHEHTWHLTSLVLAGRVNDSNLVAVPSAVGQYVGSRILYGEKNGSRQEGRFDLSATNKRVVEAGCFYEIPSRTIHLNSVAVLPTVTLVRSVEDGRGDGPLVLARYADGQGFATEARARLSAEMAFSQLAEALGVDLEKKTSLDGPCS